MQQEIEETEMTTIAVSQLRGNLSHWVSKAAFTGERICIQRNGKPCAALVPYEDMQLLERLEDKMDLELAKQALKRNELVPLEQFEKEFGL